MSNQRLNHTHTPHSLGRREFLRTGIAAAAALVPAGSLFPLAGCEADGVQAASEPGVVHRAAPTGPARELRLVAEAGEVEVGPLGVYRTWLYNGRFPGQEIRVREGERLRITVENRLPEITTVHWHGVPVPNPMDGVPDVTQAPIPPGGSFVYDYAAEPAGTYMYHSHAGLQLDRGLLGPLVIEESTPHVAYDREYTLVLDDFLPGEPEPIAARGMMGGGMMRGSGMMGGETPEACGLPAYPAFLVNGHPPADPAAFEVRRGERVRLRLINPSASTIFRVALAGHRMQVTHSDGRPVRPVEVDALLIGTGERYDVVIEANNPGTWNLVAASTNAGPGAARALLHYAGTGAAAPGEGNLPEGIRGGRLLTLADLHSVETTGKPGQRPDRTFDLTLSGGMMMARGWSIDGERYADAAPLEIRRGERVRVNLSNMTMCAHPMHLHGHFFRVGDALKDTVLVPGHMGRVSFEFTADNPGDWFFHCHILYHMERGMARVFRYV
ncbi:multicopper oxidase family protein [soil metagenome]